MPGNPNFPPLSGPNGLGGPLIPGFKPGMNVPMGVGGPLGNLPLPGGLPGLPNGLPGGLPGSGLPGGLPGPLPLNLPGPGNQSNSGMNLNHSPVPLPVSTENPYNSNNISDLQPLNTTGNPYEQNNLNNLNMGPENSQNGNPENGNGGPSLTSLPPINPLNLPPNNANHLPLNIKQESFQGISPMNFPNHNLPPGLGGPIGGMNMLNPNVNVNGLNQIPVSLPNSMSNPMSNPIDPIFFNSPMPNAHLNGLGSLNDPNNNLSTNIIPGPDVLSASNAPLTISTVSAEGNGQSNGVSGENGSGNNGSNGGEDNNGNGQNDGKEISV